MLSHLPRPRRQSWRKARLSPLQAVASTWFKLAEDYDSFGYRIRKQEAQRFLLSFVVNVLLARHEARLLAAAYHP